jgi:hypothetical protein
MIAHLGKHFNENIVVEPNLYLFIIFEGAAQNGDYKVEHQNCIDQEEP